MNLYLDLNFIKNAKFLLERLVYLISDLWERRLTIKRMPLLTSAEI